MRHRRCHACHLAACAGPALRDPQSVPDGSAAAGRRRSRRMPRASGARYRGSIAASTAEPFAWHRRSADATLSRTRSGRILAKAAPPMRILLMHHFPLAQSQAGPLGAEMGVGACSRGARNSVADRRRQSRGRRAARRRARRLPRRRRRRPICRSTFRSFRAPRRRPVDVSRTLGSASWPRIEINCGGDLDAQIDRFDPHVIHAQHIWVQGQLALETGVPYVLNAWGPELIEYAARRALSNPGRSGGRKRRPDSGARRTAGAASGGRCSKRRPIARCVMPPELNPPDGVSPAAQVAAGNWLAAALSSSARRAFRPAPLTLHGHVHFSSAGGCGAGARSPQRNRRSRPARSGPARSCDPSAGPNTCWPAERRRSTRNMAGTTGYPQVR